MHEEFPTCEIFVIGGASLYEQTIENANELHITRIESFGEMLIFQNTITTNLI